MRELNDMDVSWCVRRLPCDVKQLLIDNAAKLILAGGFIRAIIAREEISDIDLFSDSPEHAEQWAAVLNQKKGRRLVKTDNATTIYGTGLPVQFIHRWTYDTPRDVVRSFDYTICSAAIWWNGQAWSSLCHQTFYEDLASKRLVYLSPRRDEAAGGSLLRVLKYYQRGYRITMPSFAAVLNRLVAAIDPETMREESLRQDVILGLLREVDPLVAVTTADSEDHQHIQE